MQQTGQARELAYHFVRGRQPVRQGRLVGKARQLTPTCNDNSLGFLQYGIRTGDLWTGPLDPGRIIEIGSPRRPSRVVGAAGGGSAEQLLTVPVLCTVPD